MSNRFGCVKRVLVRGTPAALLCFLLNTFAVPGNAGPNRTKPESVKKLEKLLSSVGVHVDGTEAAGVDNSDSVKNEQSLQLRVQWNAYATAEKHVPADKEQSISRGEFVIKQVQQFSERAVVPRAPELSAHELVVAALDAQQRLRGWSVITDPRVLRQEQPADVTKELKKQALHHTRPEFLVIVPYDTTITELRFYSPVSSGKEFTLSLIGAAPLDMPRR